MTQMRIAVITHHKFIRYPKRGSEKAHEVSAFQHCHDCGYHKKKRGIFGKPKVENPTHVLVFAQSKELMEEHKRKGTPEGKRHGMVSFLRPIDEWDFWEAKLWRNCGEWVEYDKERKYK